MPAHAPPNVPGCGTSLNYAQHITPILGVARSEFALSSELIGISFFVAG
jgi:hypothetical protein